MKKLLLSIIVLPVFLCSCRETNSNNTSNANDDATFSIIGKWGMVSGTITNGDGATSRYSEHGDGYYYQILEYKLDGTFIKTPQPNGKSLYGTYTYNNADQSMKYKLDDEEYYVSASITIHSSVEMTIFTDWGSAGSMTQYMKKIN